nr:DUF3800 domain-containing protein [uncultured Draconibacterium sp.]
MKIPFDVSEIRAQTILLNNLQNVDDRFTFYYDETNNIRKFYLNEESFNCVSGVNFIVGGVLYEGSNSTFDIENLKDQIRLQKTANEIKLKHIAKGDFIDCLKSEKLKYFLKWLLDSDLYVHYTSLNILYFSIVDLIDSALMNFEKYHELGRWYIDLMKNDFYRVAKQEEDTVIKLFYKFEYPNIKKDKALEFIDNLIEIITPYEDIEEFHFGITSFRQLLQQSKKTGELPFVMNEEDFILLKDFSNFYMNPIYMFVNSEHIFDREDGIEEEIRKYEIINDGKIINNFKFVDSKEEQLVQISDVFIGILGKFTTYINNSSLSNLDKSISTMNPMQIENLKLIHELIDKSDERNKAFLHAIESFEGQEKYGFVSQRIQSNSGI